MKWTVVKVTVTRCHTAPALKLLQPCTATPSLAYSISIIIFFSYLWPHALLPSSLHLFSTNSLHSWNIEPHQHVCLYEVSWQDAWLSFPITARRWMQRKSPIAFSYANYCLFIYRLSPFKASFPTNLCFRTNPILLFFSGWPKLGRIIFTRGTSTLPKYQSTLALCLG